MKKLKYQHFLSSEKVGEIRLRNKYNALKIQFFTEKKFSEKLNFQFFTENSIS